MPELHSAPVVADQMNYEGLFNMYEAIRVIEKFYRQKGADKKIVFDEEFHTEKGIYIHMKYEFYKKADQYVRMIMRMWIYANNLVEVEKEIDGEKVKLHHGNLSITFDGFLQTDYDDRWSNDIMYSIMRALIEKYVMASRFKFFENMIRRYINECRAELSSYLNMNKFLY